MARIKYIFPNLNKYLVYWTFLYEEVNPWIIITGIEVMKTGQKIGT